MTHSAWTVGGAPIIQRRYRAQIYCFDEDGRLSLTDPQDVFAPNIDDAANKVTGGGVSTRGSIYALAAKVWDMHGTIQRYYRN
jgi:hypothetical protein